MKPSQGLFVVFFGFVITVLSMAPICFALFALDAWPAAGEKWGTGTLLLYVGIAWLVFGHFVMAIGVILTAVGVFTKQTGARLPRPRSEQVALGHPAESP